MWMLFVELLRYLVLAHFTTIQDLSSACRLIDWMHSWSLRSVRFCFCTRNFFSRPWESPTEWSPTICSTVPGTTYLISPLLLHTSQKPKNLRAYLPCSIVTTVTVLSLGPRICCLGEGLLAGDEVLSPVETAETCRFGRQIKKRCVE